MKKIQILLAALVAVCMSSCVNFKTEATVDVKVTKNGQPLVNEIVYKIPGDRSPLYKDNATGQVKTNGAGVAHFDLKSPDDLDPSEIAGEKFSAEATFYFCTFDAEGSRNGIETVHVKTGDKLSVELRIEEGAKDE